MLNKRTSDLQWYNKGCHWLPRVLVLAQMLLVLLGRELDLALMDLYMAIDLGMDLELVLNLLMDLRDKLLPVSVNLDKLLDWLWYWVKYCYLCFWIRICNCTKGSYDRKGVDGQGYYTGYMENRLLGILVKM